MIRKCYPSSLVMFCHLSHFQNDLISHPRDPFQVLLSADSNQGLLNGVSGDETNRRICTSIDSQEK